MPSIDIQGELTQALDLNVLNEQTKRQEESTRNLPKPSSLSNTRQIENFGLSKKLYHNISLSPYKTGGDFSISNQQKKDTSEAQIDIIYSKTCVKQSLSKRQKIGFLDQLWLNAGQKYCRMLQGEHYAILLTFIKLPFVIKIFVLSIFERLFYTGFTVYVENIHVAVYKSMMIKYYIILQALIREYSITCVKRPLKNRQNTDLNDKWYLC